MGVLAGAGPEAGDLRLVSTKSEAVTEKTGRSKPPAFLRTSWDGGEKFIFEGSGN